MRYLLILGTQRSGKTVLGRALNMHPDISIQKEPYFFYFKLCRNIFYRDILKRSDFDPDAPMDSNFCKTREEKLLLSKKFSDIYFSEHDIEELRRLTIKQQDAEGGERAPRIKPLLGKLSPGTAPNLFWQLMELLKEVYSKENLKYLGFTEGWCDEFIEVLINLPDFDINIIQCLRDVRAIAASRNKGKRLKERGYTGKYPLLFILRHWRKAIAYSLKNGDNPKYQTVQYEKFVTEPEGVLKRVCKALGVNFVDGMLDPSRFTQGDGNLWKQNTTWDRADPTKGFSTASVAKWKEVLTSDEIGVIEYLCKPEMKYLDLEMLRPDFLLHDLCRFQENEDEIEEWLKKYYLPFNDRELTFEIVRKFLIEKVAIVEPEEMVDFFSIEEKSYEFLSNQYR